MGNLKALSKLDLSENRLVELPISICELNENLQLAVGRNPLEKPSVEQARQGIGAIRRFFGFSRSKGGDENGDENAVPATIKEGEKDKENAKLQRPVREEGTPSRHDWAGPAGVAMLFNCSGCSFEVIEGSSDVATCDEAVELVAAFNLQPIGRVREPRGLNDTFEARVEFTNQWLPWKVQEIPSLEDRALTTLIIELRWRGKNQARLLVTPWIAYGCSIGSRIKLPTGYCTVTEIAADDVIGHPR